MKATVNSYITERRPGNNLSHSGHQVVRTWFRKVTHRDKSIVLIITPLSTSWGNTAMWVGWECVISPDGQGTHVSHCRHHLLETSHKKFSEGKQVHVGMEASKTNQTTCRWE